MGIKYFSIHAHFYQPPRKDPWTGIIIEETPTKIHSSYNQMITDQCYGPLAIHKIKLNDDFINLYSIINFDFGPTLLNYIEKTYPKLYITIQNSDHISTKLYGYGNAIAQVYNHAIMPLLPLHEKKLYVKWGVESFFRTFKRKPLGMWLSECACDNETLEVLIHEEIKFTILAPHQIKKITRIGDEKNVTSDIKPGMYLWKSKVNPGKNIIIFVYDYNLSKLLHKDIQNTEKSVLRITNITYENSPTIIATDGENYGHHIKSGDIYLSELIKKIIKEKKIKITNLSYICNNLKPEYEVEINENTSWSCPHGIERWKNECLCYVDPNKKYKKWKNTLKTASDIIKQNSDNFFYSKLIEYVTNPQKMLEQYIVIQEEFSPHNFLSFIQKNLRKNNIYSSKYHEIIKLFDMELKSAFFRCSCGYFFDDILNIEALNNIKNLIFVSQILIEYSYHTQEIEKIIDNIKKEKSNLDINVKEVIEKIIDDSQNYLEKMASEFSYLHYLNFHKCLYNTDWKFKINQINNIEFEIQATHIPTLKQKIIKVKILEEKSNIIFKTINIETGKTNILTLDDFNKDIKNLILILKSNSHKEMLAKQFLYKLSNSLIPYEIVKIYIELLKNNIAHTLPFAYEIALSIISIASTTSLSLIKELKKEISQTPLSSLLWKIELIMEKNYDN
ncbi:MAG: DUF3536 domain-containing protein [Elusimicrobiales bacterium]|nr:DUF3536 domain-containing protein [Elusimicrobiales bacterium]